MWLKIKVQAIYILRRLRIIPNVWYQSEIDLAGIRAKELSDFFNQEPTDI